jgi:hypothetical protein
MPKTKRVVKKSQHKSIPSKRRSIKKQKTLFNPTLFFSFIGLGIVLLAFVFYQFNKKPDNAIAGVNANPTPFFFGSGVHPENYYLEPVNQYGSTPRTLEDFERWNRSAKDGKLNMLRGGMRYEFIATSSNSAEWEWTGQDAYTNGLVSHGIEPLMVLLGYPTWLVSPNVATATQAEKDRFILEYGKFAGLFAERYGNNVTYYEVWNEPSLPFFWNWNKTDFARLLAEASYKIKQADPTAQVMFDVHALDHMINPSVAYTGQGSFMVQVLNSTVPRSDGTSVLVLDAVDILAPHSYPDRTNDIPEDMLGGRFQMSKFYEYMDGYLKWKYGNTRGKKIYLPTETGWSSRASGSYSGRWVSEEKQAALLIRTALNVMSVPMVEGFIQYDLQDDGINTNEYEHWYGMTRFTTDNSGNLVPKPAHTAFKTLVTTLDGTNFVSKTVATKTTDKKVYTYYFESPDSSKKVWAVNLANALTPLGVINTTNVYSTTIQTTSPTVTLIRLDGTTQRLNAPNNLLTISVNENPLLIVESSVFTPVATATPTSIPSTNGEEPAPTSSTVTPTPTSITSQATPTPTTAIIPTPTPTLASQSSSSFIVITNPQNGATLTGAISVTAAPTAAYLGNTQKIKIYIDGVLKKDCNYATNTCSYYWNPPVGTHTIYATAYEKANATNFTTSTTITVTR